MPALGPASAAAPVDVTTPVLPAASVVAAAVELAAGVAVDDAAAAALPAGVTDADEEEAPGVADLGAALTSVTAVLSGVLAAPADVRAGVVLSALPPSASSEAGTNARFESLGASSWSLSSSDPGQSHSDNGTAGAKKKQASRGGGNQHGTVAQAVIE